LAPREYVVIRVGLQRDIEGEVTHYLLKLSNGFESLITRISPDTYVGLLEKYGRILGLAIQLP